MTSGTGNTLGQQGTQGGMNQQGVGPSARGSMGQTGTGASDPVFDLISVLYHSLDGAAACERYMQDAQGDQELRQFFQQCAQQDRQLAEKGKQLLARRLSSSTTGH